MIIAVLDTNVLVSEILGSRNERSTPGRLLAAWRRGDFTLALSEHIVTGELPRTLAKPYFHTRLALQDVDEITRVLRRYATLVTPTVALIGVATHPEDDVVLATAISAGVAYLVTGDTKLQELGRYADVAIVSPREFLVVLERHGVAADDSNES